MTRVDCHQHVWPAALVDGLRRRTRAPHLAGDVLHLAGEPPYVVDPAVLTPSVRDDVDLALVSLSSPLGIETLPPEEAAPLLDAWHGLAADLGAGHGLWAAVNLVEPDLVDLRATLAGDQVHGLQVPATALLDPAGLERLAPVLAVVEDAGLPVLVHPGPAPTPPGAAGAGDVPGWWPALTSYPAQQASAWFAWHLAGRALLPDLRIAFVALAGLAPLHHERLVARGGTFGAVDRHVYYETSSYGPRAIDAMVRVVGVDAVVHGSDLPYAAPSSTTGPGMGEALSHALLTANPHHLMNGGSR
ncbi:amidohydrolase [Nocardioides dongxiaopingii]|uniref:amidohydrolase family protein n=1 Tax=Nocardioides sp. S-1144 TaxID=2582905 RepID=UPI00110F63BB|nr:amidohydrolase family protein [Nocardioides sp. S-1144]QCW52086.1 amidohydrolase [Nocardioides sp. S-1144]